MENDNELGPKERLKQHVQSLVLATMKRHDWSQSDLARRAGMPRNNISLYARGRSIPSYEHAVKLSRVLRVDPAELTGIAEAQERAGEDDVVDVKSTANGKYLLSLRKELSSSQLTRFLELLDQINREDESARAAQRSHAGQA
ncbi:helix-turn-helix domain-containing protein [Halomonas sp. V046]|uniref:helix-turn-helix domain-containing protein n=1 Tax=Halomonas sp. V046 TaxID=3459611 RepID=UPI0040449500